MKRNVSPYGDFDPDVSVELYLGSKPSPLPGSAEDIATEGEDDSPLSHLEEQDRAILAAWGELTAAGIGFFLIFFPGVLVGSTLPVGHQGAALLIGFTLGLWGARISLRIHQNCHCNTHSQRLTQERDN